MKTMIMAITSLLCIATANPLFAKTHDINDIKPGAKAPGMEVKMQNAVGKETSLKEQMTGKGLIVMFSCNTCPFVIKSQPRTKQIMKYAAEKGIGMVIINSNDAQRTNGDAYDDMVKYAKGQGYNVPYLLDAGSQVADMYGATHTPEVFLVDKDKNIVYRGAMEDAPADPASSKKFYLKDAIDNMLANKPVDPSYTKSIGCGIKRN